MKILIVSRVYTHPVVKGNSRAILAQAEALKQLGNDVHFLYVDEPHPKTTRKQYERGLVETKQYWGDKFHYMRKSLVEKLWNVFVKRFIRGGVYWKPNDYYPWHLSKYVRQLNRQNHFDACIVNYFELSKLLIDIDIPKKALHTHDSFTFRDIITNSTNVRALMPNDEATVMQRAQHIFALQNDEAVFFHRLSPYSNIYTIYTTIDFHNQPIVGNHNIVFLSANEKFNHNGLSWFLEKIFPKIQTVFHDARLFIGGGICKALQNQKMPEGVELCGFVDDVAKFYMQGDIAINPVYQGTGLKIKTIESLSYNKVTIVHPHSKEGLYQKESLPLFVSKEPKDWVDFLCKVWNDKDLIKEIKMRNKAYIDSMNSFILSEYKRFMDA